MEKAPGRSIHWDRLAQQLAPLASFPLFLLSTYLNYRYGRHGLHGPEQLKILLACTAAGVLVLPLFWAIRAVNRRIILTGPAVPAMVKSTTVGEDLHSLVDRYILTIGYKFYLKDEPYWGRERRFFRDPGEAETAGAGLLGREVTVHYHPRNPDRSLLA